MHNIFCILSILAFFKTPFCLRCHYFVGKLILTTELEINKAEVVYLYQALKIKIRVEFIQTYPFLKYPANIHNISLRSVSCLTNLFTRHRHKVMTSQQCV